MKRFNPDTKEWHDIPSFEDGLKGGIWDPNGELQKQLELYKLKIEIKPRKVDLMQAQDMGVVADSMPEVAKPQIYIPGKGGTF